MLKYIMIYLFFIFAPAPSLAADENSAVALLYYQIDNSYDSATLSPESFDEHLKFLESDRYNVLSLDEIITALENGTPLPENSVALTFEGAFQSSNKNAFQALIDREIPFTIFFASERIDRNSTHYMSWDDLRGLKKHPFVSFGILPSDYQYLASLSDKQFKSKINLSLSRAKDELDLRPEFFAVPYGIYNDHHLKIIKTYGFKGIFGQQGGVISKSTLGDVLPRFPMTDGYGDTDRFEVIARSKPLYLNNITPENKYIEPAPDDAYITIGFNRDLNHHDKEEPLACFGSGLGKLDLTPISNSRYEIRLDLPLSTDRLRINCTQPFSTPIPGEMPRSRWFGMLFGIQETPAVHHGDFFPE